MNENPRVLMICLTRRGGLLQFNDCLAKSLSQILPVRVICAKNAQHDFDLDGVDLQTIDTGEGKKGTITKLFSASTWEELRRLSEEFNPDIVHVTSAQEWNPKLGRFIKETLKKPLVYTVHDVVHHKGTPLYIRITESIFRRMPDAFVVLTEQAKSLLVEKGAPAEKILVVPHGVYDFTKYKSPLKPRNEILFFGRISPYKGIGVLLDAACPLTEEFPEWQLIIAGDGDIDPYLDKMVHEGVCVVNKFLDTKEVGDYMSLSSIVVLPYLSATQSGVIPIAFSFGKPVIATNVGGIPDMIKDNETGLLVPPNDVKALREGLRRLITDSELRKRLGEAGKRFAEENLGWDAIAQKHADFYKELV